MLAKIFRRLRPARDPARQAAASALYDTVVAQARQPAFYSALGVPDTVEGRYEMVMLHASAVIDRLRGEGEEGHDVAQLLFDAMFDDMDNNLREIGVSDLKVGKRMKEMAESFQGRAVAFERAIEAGDRSALEDVVWRNTYHEAEAQPSPDQVSAMAAYLVGLTERLSAQPTAALIQGQADLGPAPEPAGAEGGS